MARATWRNRKENETAMNRTEALEKYGAKQVKFASYYKYSFTFIGEGLTICVGGDVHDIYRLNVHVDKAYTVVTLMEEGAVTIWEGDELTYEESW